MKTFFLASLFFAFAAQLSAQQLKSAGHMPTEADKVMEVSRAWAATKTTGEMLSYYADNAISMAPGEPTLRGKEAIGKAYEAMSAMPGFKIDWEPKEAVVSACGDMAYVIEVLSLTLNDEKGKPQTTFHKAVSIWRKQPDGKWKCVVDTFNDDPSVTSVR